ncbi:hypothetical protein OG216_47435 (plasmid) [Streptomycetaceae bacterium NBC_01309]
MNGVPSGPQDRPPDPGRAVSWRGRRAAKRARRAAERADTAARLRAGRDGVGPGRALVGLAVLVLLAGGAWLFGQAVGGPDRPLAAADARPSAAPSAAADEVAPAAAAGPSAPPSSAARADRTGPERVAEEWVRAYLTRDPLADQSHTAAVDRAAPWAVAALTANLSAYRDPAFDRLVSLGASSTVTAVDVRPAATGLPPDTPLRVWRQTAVRITLTGEDGPTDHPTATVVEEIRTLQVELVAGSGGWLVSRVLGV